MNRKKVGIALITIGLILFFGMVVVIILDYRKWILNLDGFQNKYSTFADMLYSREKGAFLISAISGLFPFSMGTILIQSSKHRQ